MPGVGRKAGTNGVKLVAFLSVTAKFVEHAPTVPPYIQGFRRVVLHAGEVDDRTVPVAPASPAPKQCRSPSFLPSQV
jgi:hypothetical protein